MRKSIQVGLVAAVALLAIATTALFINYKKTTADLAETRAVEMDVRHDYSETIDAIAEIQDSLNAISLGDTSMTGKAWNREIGERVAAPTGQEALDRIAIVRASISRNRERIAELEEQLKEGGQKTAGLQRLVSNLRRTVGAKEALVAQLTTQVQTLETENTQLATTVQVTQDTLRVRDETLVQKQQELATVYYVFGNKDQLKQAGVIESEGRRAGHRQERAAVADGEREAVYAVEHRYGPGRATFLRRRRASSARSPRRATSCGSWATGRSCTLPIPRNSGRSSRS